MKKILLTLIVVLTAITGLQAQTFEWGSATWNIQDGRVYEDVEELNAEGLKLIFPNPSGFTLTFLNIIAVDYDLFMDDAAEPIKEVATGQGTTEVPFRYAFVEGHKYRIVTTGAKLVQANLATFTTDTLTSTNDSYTISFEVKGPELVKTYEVEGTQSLAIVDQNADPTFSLVNTAEIAQLLGIEQISEAQVFGLNLNGSYNTQHGPDYYDGWRDADGEYTLWGGGWDAGHGHNAYPAVYSIKINETADSIFYFFYDYWTVYDPDQPEEIEGSGTGNAGTSGARRLAPETTYNSVLWEWKDEDGNTIVYNRRYRVSEGQDYKAGFAIVANKKLVQINATLHFVSQEDYAAYLEQVAGVVVPSVNVAGPAAVYTLSGQRVPGATKGLCIVRNSDGTVRKELKN